MYIVTIYNDGAPTVIHDRFSRLASCTVSGERNAMQVMELTVYPDNPGYDALLTFSTTVKAVRISDGATVFDGRVLKPVPTMDASGLRYKSVTCEGATNGLSCYLHDSRVGYMEETLWEDRGGKTGLQRFIEHLLSNHNAKVPEAKRVYPGQITMGTNIGNDQVYKALNFETTFAVLKEKLVDVYGGEMTVRRASDGKLYLDYKPQIGATGTQPVAVGLNMRDGSKTPDFASLVTRLYPRGCKLSRTVTDSDGNTTTEETEERLSIATVNSGREYLDDTEAIAAFGVIEGVAEWDDVTEPLNLKTKGEAWLEENNKVPNAVAVTAYDLSAAGLDYGAFRLLDWVPVSNGLIETEKTLEIVRHVLDVVKPEASTVEFGTYKERQSRRISELGRLGADVEALGSKVSTVAVNAETYRREAMSAVLVGDEAVRTEVGERITAVSGDLAAVTTRVTAVETDATGIHTAITRMQTDVASTIAGVDVQYARSQSKDTAPTTGWQTDAPAWQEGWYIWQRTKTSFVSGSEEYSEPTCISGRDGKEGKDGKDGKSVTIKGTLASTSELPADAADGDGYLISGHLWVYGGGQWSDVGQIQGPQGLSAYEVAVASGYGGTQAEWLASLEGKDGARGSAVWTSSSAPTDMGTGSANRWRFPRSNMSTSSGATAPSAGDVVYHGSAYYPVTSVTTSYAYAASMTSIRGTNGTSKYAHFAYATSADGTQGFSTSPFSGATYLGACTDEAEADPTTPSSYDWSLIKGADGTGISKITEQYYLSSSATACTGGSWQVAQPTWVNGKFIWTRSKVEWDDGTTTYTDPVLARALNSANQGAYDAGQALTNYYTKTETDELAGEIRTTLREGYEGYTDGAVGEVDTRVTTLEASVGGLETTVSTNYSRMNARYGTCSTGASTVNKAVACADFVLTAGAMVCVRFTYSHTSASQACLNVNGTGAKAAYIGGTAITSANAWAAGQVMSFVYDGTYWRAIDSDSQSKIKQMSDSIELKVSKGDVSSQLSVESGAVSITSNRFSWTSTYSSLTSYGKLTCTSGTIGGFTISSSSIYNDRVTLYDSGIRIRYGTGPTNVGLIGANDLATDSTKYGLNFDLEYSGAYMTWAAKKYSSDSTYSMKLTYANKALPVSGGTSWTAGRLHVCCDQDFHNYIAYNMWIDPNTGGANGGRSFTMNFVQVLGMASDGTATRWGSSASITFKNGLCTGISYYS